jgi:hypothetical protein
MSDSVLRGRWRRLLLVVAMFPALLVARVTHGQPIANSGFESGDFTDWTVTLHKAQGPAATIYGEIDAGGQVLTGRDFWRDASIRPGLLGPEGRYFALISSTPGTAEDGMNTALCPTSLSVPSSDDRDDDTFAEFDVTTLFQDFSVTGGQQVSFMWSFLNSETDTGRHDTFEATLTPIPPTVGSAIQVLAYTAGNEVGYSGDFKFIEPKEFDGRTYEVITRPAGGSADCFYVGAGQGVGVGLGRTPFYASSTGIPPTGTGTWRLSFYFGDDGGDARMDSGVIIDGVRVMTPPEAAGLCDAQPRFDCVGQPPLVYRSGRLSIRKKAGDPTKNRISWTWGKGPGQLEQELGNPVSTTDYELCVYDAYGLVTRMVPAPHGGTCGSKPCWSSRGTTFKYLDRDATQDGIVGMTLKSGRADKQSSIRVKGKGTNVPMPTLPLVLPVTVQMVNSDDTCFSNFFSKANGRSDKFVARSE